MYINELTQSLNKQELSEDSVLDLFVLANKTKRFWVVQKKNQELYQTLYKQSTL